MANTFRATSIIALAIAGAVACSETTGPPVDRDEREGFVRLEYSGVMSGSVDASGRAPTAADITPRSLAFGVDVGENQEEFDAFLVAGIEMSGISATAVTFTFVGAGTGTYDVDPDCDVGADMCVFGGIDFIPNISDPAQPARWFEMMSGSITVTAIDDDRMIGTFSGVAIELDHAGEVVSEEELLIESGTFSVPVIMWEDLPNFSREHANDRIRSRF